MFPPGIEPTKAYSRVALWAKAFHPPRPEPLQLSSSAIDCYGRCPMRYMFQYVWSVRGGPHAMATFGNIMHRTIKEFVSEVAKRRKIPFEDVLTIYDREWSGAGYIDEYHEEEYRKAGRDQLEAFHRTYCAAPADVIYQEKNFELALENDVVVTGRMDQVNRLDGSAVEIIDYKTGKAKDAKAAANDSQLGIYALAAQEVLDLDPDPPGVLQSGYQRSGRGHARRQSAERNEGENRRSRGPDSRQRIHAQARLRLQFLRLQTAVPRPRTTHHHSCGNPQKLRKCGKKCFLGFGLSRRRTA